MRFLTLVLSIFLLLPTLASAATITMYEGTNTIPMRAAAGETNTIEGSGPLTDNIMSWGLSNDLIFADDANGGSIDLTFSLDAAGTNVSFYEIVMFSVDAFGEYFLSTTDMLFVSTMPSRVVSFDFDTNGDEQRFDVYFYTTDGGVPNGGTWSIFGQYAGAPIVDTGGGDGVSPVPLPAAAWLLLAGLGSLFALRRRRSFA